MAIYMNFTGIPGTVTASGFTNQIELNSFQFGIGRGIGTTVGSSQEREASTPSISEVTCTKPFDSSSTKLEKAATVDRKGVEVTISFVTTGDTPTVYLTYTLSNTLISGYSISSGGDRPSESLSLNFTKFEVSYTPADADNMAGSPNRFSYDLAQAKSS